MLSWRSRCSSMSSGTERENSVSSSCILEPEGPVACRQERRAVSDGQQAGLHSHPFNNRGGQAGDTASDTEVELGSGRWATGCCPQQLPSGCAERALPACPVPREAWFKVTSKEG